MLDAYRSIRALLGRLSRRSRVARGLYRKLAVLADVARPRIHRRRVEYYERGVRHFAAARYRVALWYFWAYLMMGGESAVSYQRATRFGTTGRACSRKNRDKLRAFFDDRFQQWNTGRLPQPNFVTEPSPTARLPDSVAGKRVLFLFPEYIFNRTDHIKSDFEDHFAETAKDVGIRTETYYTDEVSYAEFQHSPGRGLQQLDHLRRHIRDTKPDLIIFDANYFGQESTINPSFLATVRNETDVRLAALVGDAYTESQTPLADYWGEVSDLVLHSAPRSPFKERSKFKDRVLLIPWPVNRRRFFPEQSFDYDVSFVGNYTSPLRPFWLSVATLQAHRLGMKACLRPHLRKLGPAVDFNEYERILRRSRTVLNFSTHVNGTKALTGRVWQSTASGVLVLEEENDPIQEFFVPYVHYVPFANATELALLLDFFHTEEEYRRTIAAQAAEWSQLHYGNDAIWRRIFGSLPARH